jgi:hypothetical protein
MTPLRASWLDLPVSPWRAPLQPGETLPSVAVRFGAIFGNGRAFVSQLLDMPGDHLAAITVREEAARAFSRVNGIPDEALQTVLMRPAPGEPLGRVRYHGLILDRDQVETAAMRIAPRRLAQDLATGDEPWQRYLWSIRCLPADPETGEILHDRCPECGCPFWWRDIREITRCPSLSCGLRLASIPPRRLRGANLLTLQSLADLFRPERDAGVWKRLPEAVSEWPVADILDLIDWLARLERRLRGRSEAEHDLQKRSNGLALLEGWPTSIEHHLERYWQVRGSKGRLGRVLVAGELETMLQNLRSERAREFVSPVLRRVR